MTNKESAEIPGVSVQLVWHSAEDLPTLYANHLYVTHAGGHEFYLVFGELGPQVDLDVENPPESIEIKPVAKIVVSASNIKRIARVIDENVEKFVGKTGAEEGEE